MSGLVRWVKWGLLVAAAFLLVGFWPGEQQPQPDHTARTQVRNPVRRPMAPARSPVRRSRAKGQIPTVTVDGRAVDWKQLREKTLLIAFFSTRMHDLVACLRSYQRVHEERRQANQVCSDHHGHTRRGN